MKYLGVIPARKGSKGLENKNLYPLRNTPLICWTIKAALDSKICDVVITTDNDEIAKLVDYYKYPVKVIKRPDYLCGDDIPLNPVIVDVCRQYQDKYDALITLQPTSPFRTDIDIIQAVSRFEMYKADSLLSVCEEYHSIWERQSTGEVIPIRERLFNRQQEKPLYIANGAIFITKQEILLRYARRLGGKIEIYAMPPERSIDIHIQEDIELAEWIYNKREKDL